MKFMFFSHIYLYLPARPRVLEKCYSLFLCLIFLQSSEHNNTCTVTLWGEVGIVVESQS